MKKVSYDLGVQFLLETWVELVTGCVLSNKDAWESVLRICTSTIFENKVNDTHKVCEEILKIEKGVKENGETEIFIENIGLCVFTWDYEELIPKVEKVGG